jgi:hypothetical protein
MSKLTKLISLLVIAVFISGFVLMRVFAKPYAPVQPVEFDHWLHVKSQAGPELDCAFCHEHAEKGPHATIPNVTTCMACHEVMAADKPEVQKLAAFASRNEQPPWVRVYWSAPEANVYFTHKPHVKAGIGCVDCHGDVGEMRRVRLEEEHTMGWCIDCHRERQTSIDCYVCHR